MLLLIFAVLFLIPFCYGFCKGTGWAWRAIVPLVAVGIVAAIAHRHGADQRH